MKRTIFAAIAMLLCAALIAGCAGKAPDARPAGETAFGSEAGSMIPLRIGSEPGSAAVPSEKETASTASAPRTAASTTLTTVSASTTATTSTTVVRTTVPATAARSSTTRSAPARQVTTRSVTTRPVTTTRHATTRPAATRPVATTATPTTAARDSVTILIECADILDHRDKLRKAAAPFVPEDGVILAPTRVELADGDTVFDVLTRVCEANDVQLEYTFSLGFNTYYIEGIAQLYEKDCGSRSGWIYEVNGVMPNVGASAFTLSPGDEIAWRYSCEEK